MGRRGAEEARESGWDLSGSRTNGESKRGEKEMGERGEDMRREARELHLHSEHGCHISR